MRRRAPRTRPLADKVVESLSYETMRHRLNKRPQALAETAVVHLPPVRAPLFNFCLHLTIGVAILFFRYWFLEIAGAGGDDSTTGLVWITVHVLFPLTAGTAGVALRREAAAK